MRRLQLSLSSPFAVSVRGCVPLARRWTAAIPFSPSFVCRKDVRRGDRGDARRLTFEERSARRTGRSREQKLVRENLLQEAEVLVDEDVPGELEQVFTQHFDRANVSAMKVLNMAKCLESLEVDVGGGRKVVLTMVAQVIKTGSSTIEIVPQSTSFAAPILQRVSRFDGTLQVRKEQQKIKVVIPPVTTVRRDKAVDEIKQVISSFRQKLKQVRTNAAKVLQESGVDESAIRELQTRLDEAVNAFTEEKVAELEQFASDVTSMGVDESDAGISA